MRSKFSFQTISYLLTIFSVCILISACSKDDPDIPDAPDTPQSTFIKSGNHSGSYWPTNAWRTCSPEAVGINSEDLERLDAEASRLSELTGIQSIVVIKDGYIIAEKYFDPNYTADSLHPVFSITKSITATAFGIAFDDGLINRLEDSAISFFPEYTLENPSDFKSTINLRHLLTMTAGFDWQELEYPYSDPRNSWSDWINSDDRVKHVLDKEVVNEPGTLYNYNTGVSHLLSVIIEKVSSQRTDLYVNEKLFQPLGINSYEWFVDPQGHASGGHGCYLSPRSVAKIGLLYLNDGLWNGQQIVSSAWISEATDEHIQRRYLSEFHYGYQWWIHEDGFYCAVGYGGQWLIIDPANELILVCNNDFGDSDYSRLSVPLGFFTDYIRPAILNK